MKLINGQKRADFLKAENSKTPQFTADEIKEFPQSYVIASFSDGVLKGIDFAENELKNLSIEFAIWAGTRFNYNESQSCWTFLKQKHTTEKLFELFLEQREK